MTSANQTRAFWGRGDCWRAARIELDDVQPLWGGRRVSVVGTGSCSVQIVAPAGVALSTLSRGLLWFSPKILPSTAQALPSRPQWTTLPFWIQ